MPSSPLARAQSRQEQQAATEARIRDDVKAATPVPFKPPKANQENFAPDNVLTRRWRFNLPADISYETLLEENEIFSGFPNLAVGQRIEVVDEAQSFVAELFVVWRSGPRTKLHELFKHELPAVDASNRDRVTGGFRPFHVGGGKWKVKAEQLGVAVGEITDASGNPVPSVHAIWKPDLSAVSGFANKYWIVGTYPDNSITLMDQASRDAVDAAETSARLDSIADDIDTNVTYSHAFALVVLDEVNALRTNAGLSTRTAAQLKTAVRNKLDAIS